MTTVQYSLNNFDFSAASKSLMVISLQSWISHSLAIRIVNIKANNDSKQLIRWWSLRFELSYRKVEKNDGCKKQEQLTCWACVVIRYWKTALVFDIIMNGAIFRISLNKDAKRYSSWLSCCIAHKKRSSTDSSLLIFRIDFEIET